MSLRLDIVVRNYTCFKDPLFTTTIKQLTDPRNCRKLTKGFCYMETTSVASALMTKDALRLVFTAIHDCECYHIGIPRKAKNAAQHNIVLQ